MQAYLSLIFWAQVSFETESGWCFKTAKIFWDSDFGSVPFAKPSVSTWGRKQKTEERQREHRTENSQTGWYKSCNAYHIVLLCTKVLMFSDSP